MVNLSTELYNLFDTDGSHIVTFLDWLTKSYLLPTHLDVLDVGCGPGRLLKLMAGKGWRVVAMEPNPEYRAAADRIAQDSDELLVVDGGFLDIEQENRYDMIIAINAPFAYLVTVGERKEAVERVYRALKPGGILFLDMPNFLAILKSYRPPEPSITESPAGDMVRRVIQHDIDFHDATFVHSDYFYINDELADKQIHKMAIITMSEINYLLQQAGFDGMMTFNGYGARESQRINGVRMMVSARKPAKS